MATGTAPADTEVRVSHFENGLCDEIEMHAHHDRAERLVYTQTHTDVEDSSPNSKIEEIAPQRLALYKASGTISTAPANACSGTFHVVNQPSSDLAKPRCTHVPHGWQLEAAF